MTKPSECEHGQAKFDTEIYPDGVISSAKCEECGIKVKAQLNGSVLYENNGLTALKNIEQKMRTLMTQEAAKGTI